MTGVANELAEKAVDEIAQNYLARQAEWQAPDIAYAVANTQEVLVSHNASTPFRIASMSKSFTAAAILLLRDRGQLSLDQGVGDIVAELGSLRAPGDSPAVTLRHLLTMSSGLASDDPWADRHLNADLGEMRDLFESGAHFAVPTGVGFVYSNYGYAMLGTVIERVTNQSYVSFITNELLLPLAMTSTTYSQPENAAMPHRVQDGAAVSDHKPIAGDGGFGPMGGLWSTVDDLLIWTRFLADGYPARQEQDLGPLTRASRRELSQAHTYVGMNELEPLGQSTTAASSYAMGLLIHDTKELGWLTGHSGGLPGYGSNMMWSTRRCTFAICLANVTYAPAHLANLEALELLRRNDMFGPERKVDDEMTVWVERLVAWFNSCRDTDTPTPEDATLFADNVELDETFERRVASLPTTSFTIDWVTPVNRAFCVGTAKGQQR